MVVEGHQMQILRWCHLKILVAVDYGSHGNHFLKISSIHRICPKNDSYSGQGGSKFRFCCLSTGMDKLFSSVGLVHSKLRNRLDNQNKFCKIAGFSCIDILVRINDNYASVSMANEMYRFPHTLGVMD